MLKCNNTPKSDFVLGVFQQNQLIGMIGFKREVRKSSLRHKANFWGFFVLPSFRNQGAGSKLIQDALTIIKNYKWCEMIRIVLSSEDLAVKHLATKFGFTSYGLEKTAEK
ncbi:MAG: GNAT family N-acetyltransferase [Candidatus Cloacimonetes bacterium]|nr:GNAT family N-acetyltransferase [Candidatus Cloacimonadota bacterium]